MNSNLVDVLKDILIPSKDIDKEYKLEKLEDDLKAHKNKIKDTRSELDFALHIQEELENEIKELKGE